MMKQKQPYSSCTASERPVLSPALVWSSCSFQQCLATNVLICVMVKAERLCLLSTAAAAVLFCCVTAWGCMRVRLTLQGPHQASRRFLLFASSNFTAQQRMVNAQGRAFIAASQAG